MATKRGKEYSLSYTDKNGDKKYVSVKDRSGTRDTSGMYREAVQKVKNRGGKQGFGSWHGL